MLVFIRHWKIFRIFYTLFLLIISDSKKCYLDFGNFRIIPEKLAIFF